jgi:nucleoside-diphosphate-sugar epimerase
MNILVTGGCGLIGHNVVSRLQKLGHQVSIVDNKTNYGIIPQAEIDYLISEREKKIGNNSFVYVKDISNADDIDKIFNKLEE